MKTGRWLVVVVGVLGMSAACTSEESAGSGELRISVGGGTAVRDGFPHTEGDVTYEFVDGWSLQFSKYLVNFGNIRLTEPGAGEVASWQGSSLLDLRKSPSASADLTVLSGVPAARHDIGFDLLAVSEGTGKGNSDPADFELMKKSGWSTLAEGTATHATQGSVRFRFGLPLAIQYSSCINGKDNTQGIAVEASKTTGVFLYAHAIHMFWDTLSTGDESLRFDAFAAMRGDDDLVTEEELKEQDLNDLRDKQGQPLRDANGKSIFYNDGGYLPPGEQTLYHFLIRAVRAGGHFNGVGLCSSQEAGK